MTSYEKALRDRFLSMSILQVEVFMSGKQELNPTIKIIQRIGNSGGPQDFSMLFLSIKEAQRVILALSDCVATRAANPNN